MTGALFRRVRSEGAVFENFAGSFRRFACVPFIDSCRRRNMKAEKIHLQGFNGDRHPPSARENALRLLSLESLQRPAARGKFLYVGNSKLYVRGVTYGTFRPKGDGVEYPEAEIVEKDFSAISASGFNTVRTYTMPPGWLLDAARRQGLYVMVGLPWEQHVDFLDDKMRARDIERRLCDQVCTCAGHPAILA